MLTLLMRGRGMRKNRREYKCTPHLITTILHCQAECIDGYSE